MMSSRFRIIFGLSITLCTFTSMAEEMVIGCGQNCCQCSTQYFDLEKADQRLWCEIGDSADEVAGRINSDPVFLENVAQFMINGGYEPSTSQTLARQIMGKNFFGVEETIKYFGVHPTKQQLAALTEIPFSEEVLSSFRETHVLVALFPLSILDIRDNLAGRLFYNHYSHRYAWYNNQAFAKDKGEVGWKLVRKEPIADSRSKTWSEQVLLLKDEETPKAQVMVYTVIGYYLATGERLFENIYVRCSDLNLDSHVNVGHFDINGLIVSNDWDDGRYGSIGLSAVRKHDP